MRVCTCAYVLAMNVYVKFIGQDGVSPSVVHLTEVLVVCLLKTRSFKKPRAHSLS